MTAYRDYRATQALQNILNYCWSERDSTGDLELVGYDGGVKVHRLIVNSACEEGFLAKVLRADTRKDDVTKLIVPHASRDVLLQSMAQIYETMNPTMFIRALDLKGTAGTAREEPNCSTSGEQEINTSFKQEYLSEDEYVDYENDPYGGYDQMPLEQSLVLPEEDVCLPFNRSTTSRLPPFPDPIPQKRFCPGAHSGGQAISVEPIYYSSNELAPPLNLTPEGAPANSDGTPTKPVKKRRSGFKNRQYTEEQLTAALQNVADGVMSYSKASKIYGIPGGTLHSYMNRFGQLKDKDQFKLPRQGSKTALSDNHEKYLVEYLRVMSDFGCPLDMLDLRYLVKDMLDKAGVVNNQLKDNTPSNSWFTRFLRRNNAAAFVKDVKNPNINTDIFKDFFSTLQEAMIDVPSENILTIEERRFRGDFQASRIYRRTKKYDKEERPTDHPSVLFAATPHALLPPYVLFPGEATPDGIKEGPVGTVYNHSKLGWVDNATFEDFFEKIVFPWAATLSGPKLIMADCLTSHFTSDLVRTCKEKDIRFVCLGPAKKGWYIVQPLGCALFESLTLEWKKHLKSFAAVKGAESAHKENFPPLLKKVLDEITPTLPEKLQMEFKNCGLAPLNAGPPLEMLENGTVHFGN